MLKMGVRGRDLVPFLCVSQLTKRKGKAEYLWNFCHQNTHLDLAQTLKSYK